MWKKANFVAGGGTMFHVAPVWAHPAIIVGIAELGSADFTYEWVTKHQDEIRVFFEIEADVNVADEWQPEKIEPRVFITEQNYAFKVWDKSNLWKMISWVYWTQASEIVDFDIEDMLWTKCLITITHNAKGYSKVASVAAESSKMRYHEQESENFYFSLENMEKFDETRFNLFAPFVKKRIEESDEFVWYFWDNSLTEIEKEDVALEKESAERKSTSEISADDVMDEFNSPDWVVEDTDAVVGKTQAVKESIPPVKTNPFAKKK